MLLAQPRRGGGGPHHQAHGKDGVGCRGGPLVGPLGPLDAGFGIAFAKDNRELCDTVDGALAKLRDNGEFARLRARWFPAPG